ncbi:hypothetical protein ES703_12763 [subsurface metagenome]
MALVRTIPTSINTPISADIPKGRPAISRPRTAPMEARGRLTIIMSALKKERKLTTIIAKASMMATIMAMYMEEKDSSIISITPPISTSTPGGRDRASILS